MREYNDCRARREHLREIVVGPFARDDVRIRHALRGCERRARIDHDHVVIHASTDRCQIGGERRGPD
jgi:hypothetical protein